MQYVYVFWITEYKGKPFIAHTIDSNLVQFESNGTLEEIMDDLSQQYLDASIEIRKIEITPSTGKKVTNNDIGKDDLVW